MWRLSLTSLDTHCDPVATAPGTDKADAACKTRSLPLAVLTGLLPDKTIAPPLESPDETPRTTYRRAESTSTSQLYSQGRPSRRMSRAALPYR